MQFDSRFVRQLFTLLGGVAFLILNALFPDAVPFSEESVIGFFGLLAAYILGEGLDAGAVKAGFAALFKSTKFLALAAGIASLVAVNFLPSFPLSADLIFQLLSAIVIGKGASDGLRSLKK